MKKHGILNTALLAALTNLRHTDSLVICDAGYPVPKGGNLVDVSLIAGIPTVPQVLSAVLEETIFESVEIFAELKTYNEAYHRLVCTTFGAHHPIAEIPMARFFEHARDSGLFIRTGDLSPCANIRLVIASGVEAICKPFNLTLNL